MLTLEKPQLKEIWGSWRRILHIGMPAAFGFILLPVTAAILVRIVSSFGTEAVAAYSAGTQVERMAVMPIVALGASLVPFIGQNWGAGLHGRILGAQRIANRFVLLWGGFCVLAIAGAALKIASIFSRDLMVQKHLMHFLWIMPLAFCARGLSHNATAAMNAINHPYHAAALISIRLLLLTLPLAVVGAWTFGFVGLLVGVVLGETVSGFLGVKWIDHLYKVHVARSENTNDNFAQPGIETCLNQNNPT